MIKARGEAKHKKYCRWRKYSTLKEAQLARAYAVNANEEIKYEVPAEEGSSTGAA